MNLPTSCYRLQFRQGMDFDRAAEAIEQGRRIVRDNAEAIAQCARL